MSKATSEEETRPSAPSPYQEAIELRRELAQIDELIRQAEVEASRQADEAVMRRSLDERERLVRRKEALPFLIRGARARHLQERAGEHRPLRDAALLRRDRAAAEHEEATRAFDEAAETLEATSTRLKAAGLELASSEHDLQRASAEVNDIEAEVRRVERGEPTEREWFTEE